MVSIEFVSGFKNGHSKTLTFYAENCCFLDVSGRLKNCRIEIFTVNHLCHQMEVDVVQMT